MKIIKKEDVIYIGKLAKISLKEEEIENLSKELDQILAYIAKLNQLDTSNTPPTSHVLDLSNVFREDTVRPSLAQGDVLKNAPSKFGDFFKVPKVIEET